MHKLARRIKTASQLSGSFTLRSGKVSDTYFDKYRFEADPVLLLAIANAVDPAEIGLQLKTITKKDDGYFCFDHQLLN